MKFALLNLCGSRQPVSVHAESGTVGRRVALTAAVLLSVLPGRGQEIEPRRWSHLPIGANFAGVAYAYSTGDISLDPALKIQNGQFDLQTIGVKYIRSFELFDHSARVDLSQPYQIGHWTGLLNGAPGRVERTGWGDASVRFAVNLFGAPPLKGKEFADYRANKADGETLVGAGLTLQLPTGQYYEDKLINLGGNRFTFHPQLGVVHAWGKWSAEFTGGAWFFTDNDEFFNGKRLEQAPVFGADASLIYTIRPGLWLAGSLGYATGGETTVNGVANRNYQNSPAWGFGVGVPFTRATGMKLAYIGTRTQTGTGVDADTFLFVLSTMW